MNQNPSHILIAVLLFQLVASSLAASLPSLGASESPTTHKRNFSRMGLGILLNVTGSK